MYRWTVRFETRIPILRSSPRIRSAPHLGFFALMSRIVDACEVRRRPPRRDRHRQNTRNPARCHRSTVAGSNNVTADGQVDVKRDKTPTVHRSVGDARPRFPSSRRFATASCCRSSSFSATSAARDLKNPATNRTTVPIIAWRVGARDR